MMELFTVKEVAKILKINVNGVYELIKKGHIQCLKLGSIKVTSRELERFISYAEGKDFTDIDDVKEYIYC